MNVLAQKSFASAIGLSADELANQLKLQKLAVESGKSLAQITEEEAIEAQKRQNIQDKFNAAVEKLQDIIGNLLAGPFSQLLETLSNILQVVGLIGKPFALINKLIDSITGSAKGLGTILKGILGVMAAIAVFQNPLMALGSLAVAGAVVAGAQALIPEMAKGGIVPATPGGKIVKVAEAGQDEAIIPLNQINKIIAPKQDEQNNSIKPDNKENTIKGTNLNRINIQPPPVIDNSALIAAINRQTDIISSKNYTPTLQTVIGGSVVATAATQNSYNLA
jgi:hypothetical protein